MIGRNVPMFFLYISSRHSPPNKSAERGGEAAVRGGGGETSNPTQEGPSGLQGTAASPFPSFLHSSTSSLKLFPDSHTVSTPLLTASSSFPYFPYTPPSVSICSSLTYTSPPFLSLQHLLSPYSISLISLLSLHSSPCLHLPLTHVHTTPLFSHFPI